MPGRIGGQVKDTDLNYVHGQSYWPGVVSVLSCKYTASHGITPGVATLEILPQASPFATRGDLLITDNFGDVLLKDCRLFDVAPTRDSQGQTVRFAVQDRRWRWRDLEYIDGLYNQLDDHGKLIPWTIRSPEELVKLCYEAMGEPVTEIDVPDGFSSADYPNYTENFLLGENVGGGQNVPYPIGKVNPRIDWKLKNPAQALQELADLFGRRIVYRPIEDDTIFVIPGRGDFLPEDGSIATEAQTVESPTLPTRVGIGGAPTDYQGRLLLQAMAEEWDGSYVPINSVSYAPKGSTLGAKHSVKLTFVVEATAIFTVTFKAWVEAKKAYDTATASVSGANPAAVIADFTALLAAIGAFANPISSIVGGSDNITFTAQKPGPAFSILVSTVTIPAPPLKAIAYPTIVTVGQFPGTTGDWSAAAPPIFAGIRATPRLTLLQARELAQRSVWKVYRLQNPVSRNEKRQGVNQGRPTLDIPGVETDENTSIIKRRQDVIISDRQVEQIKPDAEQTGLLDPRTGEPLILDVYNGYSRAKPAVVYGSAVNFTNGLKGWYLNLTDPNTARGKIYPQSFSVDPEKQQISFSEYVYFYANGQFLEPTLHLLCACNVRDSATNQPVYYRETLPVPGGDPTAGTMWKFEPSVQLNVVTQWNHATGQPIKDSTRLLEDDAINRAKYYLTGMVLNALFSQSVGATVEYNGIREVDLDAAIQQVTWTTGPGEAGAGTTASRGNEHSLYVPPYPERRRAENLASLTDAALTGRRLGPGELSENSLKGGKRV